MKWIDEVILGLIEVVGSNSIYDIISHLKIYVLSVEPDNYLLHGNRAVYNRIGDFECIYLANDLSNKEFVLAHEVGHAILHVDEFETFYNPLLNKGKLENEANYFATKLLYSDYELEEGIHTREQLADRLGIDIDFTKFIFGN